MSMATPFIGANGKPVKVSKAEAEDLRRMGVKFPADDDTKADAEGATTTEGGAV